MATMQVQYDSASAMRAIRLSSVSDAHASSENELPRKIEMSQRDFQLFLVAVNSDAKQPNEALRSAADKFKHKYR